MEADGRTNVVLVEHLPQVVRNIRKCFKSVEEIAVLEVAKSAAEAMDVIRVKQPEVVLVDQALPDVDGIRFIEMVHQEFPEIQIVIISKEKHYDHVLKAMRSGAFDFLTHDVSLEELTEVIKRGTEMTESERKRLDLIKSQPPVTKTAVHAVRGSLVSVYSPKGGAGVTTLAINLGLALRSPDYNVALIDGDLQYGDVALMFNEIGKLSALDLAPRVQDMDAELVADVMLYHKSSGIYMMPAPGYVCLTGGITGEQFSKVLEQTREIYRYAIINTQPFINEISLSAMDCSELTIVAITQEIACLRAARSFLEMWDSLGLDRNRLMFVVNRFNKNNPISVKKIAETIKHPVLMALPNDPAAYKAANLGVPLIINDKNSPLARAVVELAAQIPSRLAEIPVEDRDRIFLKG